VTSIANRHAILLHCANCKILLKSDNRLMSYGKKTIIKIPNAHLEYLNFKMFIFGLVAVIEF